MGFLNETRHLGNHLSPRSLLRARATRPRLWEVHSSSVLRGARVDKMDNTSGSPTDHAQQATGSDDGVERQQQPDSATKSPPDSIERPILDPSMTAEQAASAKRGSFGTSMIVGRVKGQDKGTLIKDVTITATQGFLSDEPIRGLQFLQRLAGAGSTSTEGS
eukprot:COSAG06_NODE_8871_length_2045_cov_1.855087_1_plen_162_part_00